MAGVFGSEDGFAGIPLMRSAEPDGTLPLSKGSVGGIGIDCRSGESVNPASFLAVDCGDDPAVLAAEPDP